jgi:hypothetical protein
MGICVAALVIVAGVPAVANASFPGQNGKFVWTIFDSPVSSTIQDFPLSSDVPCVSSQTPS